MSDPVVETPLPVSAIAVQRSVALKPELDTLAFSLALDATADRETAYQLMDFISAIADRERLKVELAEARKALRIANEQPAQTRRQIAYLRDQRAKLAQAQMKASAALGRRDHRPTAKQMADLEKYDSEIRAGELSLEKFGQDRPINEWKIACIEARIAGRPEPEPPPELDAALDDLMPGQVHIGVAAE